MQLTLGPGAAAPPQERDVMAGGGPPNANLR